MVDHGHEVSSQPKLEGLKSGDLGGQITGNRMLQADASVVTEMAAVHLLHTTGNATYTVTIQRYVSLLEQSVILGLQATRCYTTTMFMQDGALPHIPIA